MDASLVHRAIALRRRLHTDRTDVLVSELFDLSPQLEELLLDGAVSGETWAWGVLAFKYYTYLSGQFHTYDTWLRQALDVAQEPETLGWLHCEMANHMRSYQQPAEALTFLDKVAVKEASVPLRMYRTYVSAMAMARAGRLDEALAMALEGLEFARAQQSPLGQCQCLGALSMLSMLARDYEAVLDFSGQVLSNPTLLAQDVDRLTRQCSIAARVCLRDYEETLRQCVIFEEELVGKRVMPDIFNVLAHHKILALVALARLQEALELEEALSERLLNTNRSLGLSRLKMFRSMILALGPAQDDSELQGALEDNAHEGHKDNVCLLELMLSLHRAQPYDGELIEHPLIGLRAMTLLARLTPVTVADLEAFNPLERVLCERFLGPSASVHVRGDFEAVSLDGQTWVDLRRKRTGRRILQTLAGAAPKAVDAWSLFEAVWPDATIRGAEDLNRLYTAIHRLKASGLAELFVLDDIGYRWALPMVIQGGVSDKRRGQ